MKDEPNLFSFATKELSQDAFIGWLLAWGDNAFAESEPDLHRVARDLIGVLLRLDNVNLPQSFKTVTVKLQKNHIDVAAYLDDQAVILIEDKIDSKQHSNQLIRYLSSVEETRPRERIAAIYFKTGDQSNYRQVEKEGFKVFHRRDFLSVLETGQESNIKNSIFADYLKHLATIQVDFMSYETRPGEEKWSHRAWRGLFTRLLKGLDARDGDWGYIANKTGGFMGMWWEFRATGPAGKKVYLQLEDGILAFKINAEKSTDANQRRALRNQWHSAVMAAAHPSLQIRKPVRFGNGRYMTVAVLPEYRRFAIGGILDIDATLEVLQEAEEIHRSALGLVVN